MPPRTENRLSEDERRSRSQELFELIRQRQFNRAFPPETLLDLDETEEAEVWTPHPIIHRPLFELLRFGRHINEYEHCRVHESILPRLVGVCENQLLYWHLSGAVTEANNPVDRILITENSGQFWFDYIPTVADRIRSDLLDDTHIYFVNRFILNHYRIELGFNEIRLRRTEEGSLSFVVVDAEEFTYYWTIGRWETTLRNPDTRTINPAEFHNAPNPVAYSRVFTPLPRSSIEERFSNQVPQATASIEEVSETDTIEIDELIELAAAVEGRPSTPSTGSELPPSSDAYTPRLEEIEHTPERCWCQREVCHCNYRPRTPPTPPGITLWKPGSLNLPSQS